MAYTYQHAGDNEIWVSLNDLSGPEYAAMGLTLLDTGEDDPRVTWDESFMSWMNRFLEESGEPFLRWAPADLSKNHLYQRIKSF